MQSPIPKPALVRVLPFIAAAFLAVPALWSADSPDPRREELRRKEREIEQLKKNLNAAETEIRRLKAELAASTNVAPARPPVAAAPARPLASLPPLKPSELVDASELAQHFAADPAAAGSRYTRQVLRVRGPVSRLDPRAFQRKYNVLVGAPAGSLTVQCQFEYPPEYKTVYVRENDEVLVALTSSERPVTLARLGDMVTVQGRCAGRQGNRVVLERCEIVRSD